MENLGDFFPHKIKKKFAREKLKPGTVLRLFVKDTVPPKIKRLIIIAVDNENYLLATLFINSEINPMLLNSEELIQLQFKIDSNKFDFIKHDSYVDCSKLKPRNIEQLSELIIKDPKTVIGEVDEVTLRKIKKIVKKARTIPVGLKKQFRLFV